MSKQEVEIFAITKTPRRLIDGSKPPSLDRFVLQPGRHKLERIPNPFGREDTWLVLKGTLIGFAEEAWHAWKNGVLDHQGQPTDWGDWEIIIEEIKVRKS